MSTIFKIEGIPVWDLLFTLVPPATGWFLFNFVLILRFGFRLRFVAKRSVLSHFLTKAYPKNKKMDDWNKKFLLQWIKEGSEGKFVNMIYFQKNVSRFSSSFFVPNKCFRNPKSTTPIISKIKTAHLTAKESILDGVATSFMVSFLSQEYQHYIHFNQKLMLCEF